MQPLFVATDQGESQLRCARALLDGVPPVIWYVRSQMRRQRGLGISVPQYRLLTLLRRMGSASLSTLAEHLGASLPTASRMVTAMVEKGLITRQDDPDDRRQISLVLTPDGQALAKRARAIVNKLVAAKVAALTPPQQDAIVEAMRLVQGVFETSAPPAALKVVPETPGVPIQTD